MTMLEIHDTFQEYKENKNEYYLQYEKLDSELMLIIDLIGLIWQ